MLRGLLFLSIAGCIRPVPDGGDREEDNGGSGGTDDTDGDAAAEPIALDSDAQLVGDAHRFSGFALMAAGDVNADGYGDLYVGAPGYDPDDTAHTVIDAPAGMAYLVHGPLTDGNELTAASTLRIYGEMGGDGAGSSLAQGDVNADGVNDLVVGAPYANIGGVMGGVAYILYGTQEGDVLLSGAQRISIDNDDSRFGWKVAVGDVNADGVDDLAASAPLSNGGAVTVTLGSATGLGAPVATIHGADLGDMMGTALLMADLDADGTDEIVTSSPNVSAEDPDGGTVYVFSGGAGEIAAADADRDWAASHPAERFGASLAATDVDGDGTLDLVVGVPGMEEDRGAVVVIGAPLTAADDAEPLAVLRGEELGDFAGGSVATLDHDGDGATDLIVGATNADHDGIVDAGHAYLVLGPIAGSMELGVDAYGYTAGDAAYDFRGKTVAAVGDMNGDGMEDWAAASPSASLTGSLGGATFLFMSAVSDPGPVDFD